MGDLAHTLLVALEQSGFGTTIRQSVWIYPAANVTHIAALVVFAGALTVMDLRLLGAFGRIRPEDVIPPARWVAIFALLAQISSGLVLFTAEASHVALNPVFQTKMALMALGLLNALVIAHVPREVLQRMAPNEAFAPRVQLAAATSLLIWLCVAVLGRLIAYY